MSVQHAIEWNKKNKLFVATFKLDGARKEQTLTALDDKDAKRKVQLFYPGQKVTGLKVVLAQQEKLVA